MSQRKMSGPALVPLFGLLFFGVLSWTIALGADPTRPAWTSSNVKGSPQPPAKFKIEPAFPQLSFAKPSSIKEVPGGRRFLVTQMDGKVFTFPRDAKVSTPDLVVDLTKVADARVSLFGSAFHPKFANNRFLFLCYVHHGEGHTRVSRFQVSEKDNGELQVEPKTERVIIQWPSGGHNGGCLQFGKEGNLYISTGDGSGPNPPDGRTTGQDVSDLLGAILRLDVDRESSLGNYTVPPDNPFVDTAGARPEIWSYGLRNPWKFAIDSQTGDVFVADNGWESWELIHKLHRGSNCGWPIMEGRAQLRTDVKRGPTPITPPIKDHSHAEANSVIGGFVYRGQKHDDLAGTFVYGDYITGTIWGVRPAANGYEPSTLVDTDLRIVAFAATKDDRMFVLDYDFSGQVYELLPSNLVDNSSTFPRRLSQTGLFESTEDLTPANGVEEYSVIVNRWTDGTTARRWVAIPGTASVDFSATSHDGRFPAGTVFAKELSLLIQGKPKRLETQILHFENGSWNPYSYLWNAAGTDATLVDSVGAETSFEFIDESGKSTQRTWHVNAVNECRLCHNAKAGYVLGFTPRQLNRDLLGSSSSNQLASFSARHVVQLADSNDDRKLVDPHDAANRLDDRARSYLHANCSMCHHRGGSAIVSFYLHRDYDFDDLRTYKGTGIGTFGIQNAKLIAPGDPYRSVLMYRMSKLGYGRMPYIGSRLVDSKGVSLIAEWIRKMPPQDQVSNPIVDRSEDAKSLQQLRTAGELTSEAIQQLLKSTSGAMALSTDLHRDKVASKHRQAAVKFGSSVSASDIRGLFDHFLPESERRRTLGPNPDPQSILDLAGDEARGKLIFFSDNARCRNCHVEQDRDQALGPTLAEIRKKYKQKHELLKHILQPSAQIEEKLAAWNVLRSDGVVVSGLLVSQDKIRIVIKTAEKKVVRIPRDDIDEMQQSKQSLMPAGIISDLTAQEASDLLQFLISGA